MSLYVSGGRSCKVILAGRPVLGDAAVVLCFLPFPDVPWHISGFGNSFTPLSRSLPFSERDAVPPFVKPAEDQSDKSSQLVLKPSPSVKGCVHLCKQLSVTLINGASRF